MISRASCRIDPKLAWKIAKVIDCADPFAAAQYAPGSGGLRTFLRAAGRRHAPRAVLDAARQAFTEFEGLINFHAGSRRVFDQMLAAHTNEDEQPRLALEQRKLAFQGNSYTWGVQARLVLRTHILHVAADPRMWGRCVDPRLCRLALDSSQRGLADFPATLRGRHAPGARSVRTGAARPAQRGGP